MEQSVEVDKLVKVEQSVEVKQSPLPLLFEVSGLVVLCLDLTTLHYSGLHFW